jgi:hypothetical protein
VSGVASSISSSSSTGAGWMTTISDWVAKVVDAIRNCLANLPFIGHCFGNAGSSSSVSSSVGSSSTAVSDADLMNVICAQFPVAVAAGATAPGVPAADVVAYAKNLFGQIHSPVVKLQALAQLQAAVNSTDAIVKEFFDTLPAALQDDIKGSMYVANGNTSVFNGHDHMGGFGDHMVHNEIRSDVAKLGITQHIARLQAAVRSSAVSTTGTAATTV